MSQANSSRPSTAQDSPTVLLADAPTVIVNDRVAAVEEQARPVTTGERYVVVGVAGRGGMGTVHVARDVELMRRVALKELSPDAADDRAARARFVREVQVTAQLDHPHIVPVYGLEVADGGRPAYAMKLVEGRTFSQLIAETKDAYEREAAIDEEHSLATRLERFLKVCDAIEYAHARGVVHRDLKPANLMIGGHGEVYVMDWGICRLLAHAAVPAGPAARAVEIDGGDRTVFGTVIGTPLYMSPEQAQGRHDDLNARSDQCSLGLILFELVTLRRPFAGRTTFELLQQAEFGAREPVQHFYGEEVPREIAAIIERATARDADARYPDVAALAHDVRRFLRGEATDAMPDTAWQHLVRRLARHRQMVALAVLAFAVVCLTAIAGLVWRSDRVLKAQQSRERRLEAFANELSQQGDRLQTRLLDIRGELDALAMVASYAVEFGIASKAAVPWVERLTAGSAPRGEERGVYGLLSGASHAEADALARRLLDAQKNQHEVVELARRTLGGAADARVGSADAAVQALVAAYDVGLVYVYPAPDTSEQISDPRSTSWFREAADPGTQWSTLDVNTRHGGRELVVSEAVQTAAGRVRGGIGLVLSLDHALTNLLREGQIPGVRVTLLLDRDGSVLATHHSTNGQLAGDAAEIVRSLPLEEIRRAIQRRDVGFVEANRSGVPSVVAFDRIHPLDWMLLAIVDEQTLLALPTLTPSDQRAAR